MAGLASFLAIHQDSILRIRKPVKLDHIGALVAQAGRTIVFESLCSYPEYQIADLLFVDRKAQARVLDCEPTSVVKRLAEIVRLGPKPLRLVGEAPCQERVFAGDDVDLGMLPISATPISIRILTPPASPSIAIRRRDSTTRCSRAAACSARDEMVTSFVTPTANRMLAAHRAAGIPHAAGDGHRNASGLGALRLLLASARRLVGAGAVRVDHGRRRAEVVKCKTVDLMVPADASIVIEGYVSPTRTAQDGPSPGPTMLFTPYASQQPVFEVTAITCAAEPDLSQSPDDAVHRSPGDAAAVSRGHPV